MHVQKHKLHRKKKNKQSNWTTLFSILLEDPDVCKYHLVGDCPHEMWVNQAMPRTTTANIDETYSTAES